MARDRRELLDDNGLPIGAYGRNAGDDYDTLSRSDLLKKCREQRLLMDRYLLERKQLVEHIASLRGEEPGEQADQPPKVTRRRLRLP